MRPPIFLLLVMQFLCKSWGLEKIILINPKNHVKQRWYWRRKRIKIDYQGLWRNIGGKQTVSNNFLLPSEIKIKPILEIPSRKRSQYKKRYEIMRQIDGIIKQFNWSHANQKSSYQFQLITRSPK